MLKLIIANIEIPAVQVFGKLIVIITKQYFNTVRFYQEIVMYKKEYTNKGDYPSSLQNVF